MGVAIYIYIDLNNLLEMKSFLWGYQKIVHLIFFSLRVTRLYFLIADFLGNYVKILHIRY